MYKKKERKKGYKILMGVLLSFIFLISHSVSSNAQDLWTLYQNNAFRHGSQDDTTTVLTQESIITNLNNIGFPYQTQVADLDQDNAGVEFILFDEDTLQIYNFENGAFTLEAQLIGVGFPRGHITQYDYDTDDFAEFMLIMNMTNSTNQVDHFVVYEFNGTDINQEFNISIQEQDNDTAKNTGLACGFSNFYSEDICAFIDNINEMYIIKLDSKSVVTRFGIFGTNAYDFMRTPILVDLDNAQYDSTKELIFKCDTDNNDKEGYCIYDIATQSLDVNFDSVLMCTGLSNCDANDGNIDNLESVSSQVLLEPVLIDADDDNDYELIGESRIGTSSTKIVSWESTGALRWATTFDYSTSGSTAGSFLIDDFNSDNKEDIIVYAIATFDVITLIEGVDGDFVGLTDGNIDTTNIQLASPDIVGTGFLTLADLTNDGIKDIIQPNGAFQLPFNNNNADIGAFKFNTTNIFSLFNEIPQTTRANEPSGIPVDLDEDGNLEVLFVEEFDTWVVDNNVSNVKPTINRLVSDTGNPVCFNNIVTYQVEYTDPEGQQVYTAIDCFGNITELGNLAWSSLTFAPTRTCNYTELGTFDTKVYIIDHANRFDTDVNIDREVRVSIGGCFETGSSEGVETDITNQSLGFSEYGLNNTYIDENLLNRNEIDGYDAKVFDWSLCNDWTVFRGVCPAWVWFKQGLNDLWVWIFGFFWIFLSLLLVLLIGAIIFKRRFGGLN